MTAIYGLIRASSAKQKNSPEIQESEIRDAAAALESKLNATYEGCFVDEKTSAGKIRFLDREGVRELAGVLKPRDVVVVTRLDRMTRSFRDTADFLDWLVKHRVRLVDLSCGVDVFDTETYNGAIMVGAKTIVALGERTTNRQRTLERNRWLRKIHRPVNRNCPVGYRAVTPDGRRINWKSASVAIRRDAEFVVDEDELNHMAEASARWANGESLLSILRDFNARGLRAGSCHPYGNVYIQSDKRPGAKIDRLRRGIEWYRGYIKTESEFGNVAIPREGVTCEEDETE